MDDNRIHRRLFLKKAGVLTAGILLSSCAPKARGLGPHGSDEVELVYQDCHSEWFPNLAGEQLAVFSLEQPSIHVFYSPNPPDLTVQMPLDFEAGTAPDVLSGCCSFFPEWAQKGYLLDLRPYIEADLDRSIISDWSADHFKALSLPGGLQFGLPKYRGSLALFFNKQIFDRYDVDYPHNSWTHSDYASAMELLRIRNGAMGEPKIWPGMLDFNWERIQVHINGWGGHIVDPADNSRSLLDESAALNALTWLYEQLSEKRNFANLMSVGNLSTSAAFSKGMLATVEDGSWALKDILENASFPFGVTSFPAGPAAKVTLSSIDGFGIYTGTKYPEAAWELLKFLVSRDYGRAMIRHHLLPPARISLVEEWLTEVRMQYPSQAWNMDLEAFIRSDQEGVAVTPEVFSDMGFARPLVEDAWNQIFNLKTAGLDSLINVSLQIERHQV
jgi:multiple sugar transport system substrate-binding protein